MVKGAKTYLSSYNTNYAGALELFDDLIALHQPHSAQYAAARATVSAWLKSYPMKTSKWGPFFEDVPTEMFSNTEINADTQARHILEHPSWTPIGNRIRRRFSTGDTGRSPTTNGKSSE